MALGSYEAALGWLGSENRKSGIRVFFDYNPLCTGKLDLNLNATVTVTIRSYEYIHTQLRVACQCMSYHYHSTTQSQPLQLFGMQATVSWLMR
jgi:hypothetical protein